MPRPDSGSATDSSTDAQQAPHAHHGYDPNQPRVPAGHSYGGQWTNKPGGDANGSALGSARREVIVDRTGQESWGSFVNTYQSDGTLAEQRVFNRDGSRIVSKFNTPGGPGDWDERHTVVMRDGRTATFENSGDIQRIYDGDGRLLGASEWTNDGPEALPRVQQAFLPALIPPAVATVELGLILFTWLASQHLVDSQPIISVPSSVSRPGTETGSEPVRVGVLMRDKLEQACPKYGKVQEVTNEAASSTDRAKYRNAAEYGTAVHLKVEAAIDELKEPRLESEISMLKTLQETGELPNREKEPGENQKAWRGQKGSIRIDVLEKTDSGLVCVYDIKTGKSGLSPSRIAEIARAVYYRHPHATGFVVTEVRPH